jgi:hypothetical protein
MLMGFRKSNWKWIAGAVVLAAAIGLPVASRAQSPGDIIRIGSPGQWSQYESYWNQLINLSAASKPASAPAGGSIGGDTATDPAVLEKRLLSNIKVSKIRLEAIVGWSGASQLMGSITNNNSKAVTVSSVNFDIYKSSGELQQTTSAQPQPTTIPPGGTVTFSQQLPTIPADSGYQARLAKTSPVTIAGGV